MTPERWRQVTGVFHAALERDPAERASYLGRVCAGDADLRLEVDAMLAAHDDAVGSEDVPPLNLWDHSRLLDPGVALGAYRIEALIGSGGMGHVYRAHDSRIGRDVAIKVLLGAYSSDAERLRRFEQEARALGALNHPNLVTLYDIGQSAQEPYLVIELLDGETLRDRLSRGTVAPRRACEIVAGIARGLSAAHAKGIVHRDLKPENVQITSDGRVKIMDFGIAKLRATQPDVHTRTVAAAVHSAAGTLVGTAGYMAPEQIRGDEADERADIFAVGVILHELITGHHPFERASTLETLHSVLSDDPPLLGAVNAPPALDAIVQRCLEKDPEARFQSARDLAFALETITRAAATQQTAAAVPALHRRSAVPLALGVGAIVAVAAAAAFIWWPRRVTLPGERGLARFAVSPPQGMRFLGPPTISPDGGLVVYPAGEGPVATQRLFVRRIDQLTSTPLPGTEGANIPFFAPDGRSVGFWADDKLKITTIDGTSAPRVLCGVEGFLGGTWTSDGTIIFGSLNHGLQRVPAAGGTPQALTAVNAASEIDHHTPKILPGERALLVTVHEGGDRFRIDLVSLATSQRRTLVSSGFDSAYAPTGHLVYAQGTELFTAPFDLDRLDVTGPPHKLLDNVMTYATDGVGDFALSPNGTMVARMASGPSLRTLAWADRAGTVKPLTLEPRTYWTPRLSPDGRRFAVVVEEQGRRALWVYRVDNSLFTQVTFDGVDRAPVWTRDGTRLVYSSERQGLRHLMWLPSDGTAHAETLLSSESDDLLPGGWSADGRTLIYAQRSPTDESQIRVLPIEARVTAPFPDIPARSTYPTLSPDGRWMAFNVWPSGGLGRPDIYVAPFPGPGQYRRIAEAAGQPVWSRGGDTLYYRSRRGGPPGGVPGEGMFELPFDRTRGIAAGPERQLFRQHFPEDSPWWGAPGFDVTPDGRFLVVIADDGESFGGTLNVLLHVDEELRRQMR